MASNRRPHRTLLAAVCAAAIFVVPVGVLAMPIADWDKLSSDNRALYLTALASRSEKYLTDRGRLAEARRLEEALFGKDKKTLDSLYENLETARSVGRETGKVAEVEHAWLLTLREIGIDIPKAVVMKLMDGFNPSRDVLRLP